MLTYGSLFAGIGGIDLGLDRAGFECRWQIENDSYCRAVLRKHWSAVPKFGDIQELTGVELRRVDLIAGGFPCQPVSLAGRRRGIADERWLWPEFARLLGVLRPRYALIENVPGLLAGGGMAAVLGDLAALGFDAEWDCVAAAHVGAPHLRYRVFVVAYRNSRGCEGVGRCGILDGERSAFGHDANGRDCEVAVAGSNRLPGRSGEEGGRSSSTWRLESEGLDRRFSWQWQAPGGDWPPEPDVGRVAHGIPSRVDRLRALGNAVVPQVAEYVGTLIRRHAERAE